MNKKQLLDSLKREGFPPNIIKAFEEVKRENFVPEKFKDQAYNDSPLPLLQASIDTLFQPYAIPILQSSRATISQPYTIAFMLNKLELKKGNKVLEIGSGSGYVLALISSITHSKTYGIEIIKELANQSTINVNPYNISENIKVIHKNGKNGLPEHAPYDRILISASCKEIPKHLIKQLKPNGIIVTSAGHSIFQIKKQKSGFETKEFPGFVFVPLVY